MRFQDTSGTMNTFLAGSFSLLLFLLSAVGSVGAQIFDDTLPVEPTVATLRPGWVDSDAARLEALVFPGDHVTTIAWFEWGVTPDLLTLVTPIENIGSLLEMRHRDVVSGLSPDTTYYYRAVTENENGIARGDILSFRTPPRSSDQAPGDVSDIEVIKEVRRCLSECEALTQDVTLFPGDEVEFIITVRNRSGETIHEAVIEDVLPSSLEYIAASEGGNYNGGARLVSWPVDEFLHNHEVVVSFRASVRQLSDPVADENVAIFSAPPIRERSNPTALNVNISAKPLMVSIEMTPGARNVSRGDRVFFVVRYRNVAENEISPVSFRMLLPSTMKFSESVSNGISESNGALSFRDDGIGPGEERSVGFFAEASRGIEDEETLITVVAEYQDPETGSPNNTVAFVLGSDEPRSDESQGGILSFLPATLLGWVLFSLLLTVGIGLVQYPGSRKKMRGLIRKIREAMSQKISTRRKKKQQPKQQPSKKKEKRTASIPGWPFDKGVSFEGDRVQRDKGEEEKKSAPGFDQGEPKKTLEQSGGEQQKAPEHDEPDKPGDELDEDMRRWLYESPRTSELPKDGGFEDKKLPK